MLNPARRRWCTKGELNGNLDSENNHRGSRWTLCITSGLDVHKKTDKPLRQGCERAGPPRGQDWSNAARVGWLEKDSCTTMDSSHRGNDFHRLEAIIRVTLTTGKTDLQKLLGA